MNINLEESLKEYLDDEQINSTINFLNQISIEPKIDFVIETFHRRNFYNINITFVFNNITISCDEFKLDTIKLFSNDFDWAITNNLNSRDIIYDYILDTLEAEESYVLISEAIANIIKIHIDNYFKTYEYKSKLEKLKLEIIKNVSKQLSDAKISIKEFQAAALLS